jgi:hypothetical protein
MTSCLLWKYWIFAWGTYPGRDFQVGHGMELEQSTLVLIGEEVSNARAASQKFPHQGHSLNPKTFAFFFVGWLMSMIC